MNRMDNRKRQIRILTAILGMIGLLLLGRQITPAGIACLAAIVEIHLFFSGLLTECIPDYAAKLIRGRVAKAQYKNAKLVFSAVCLYSIAAGLFGSFLLFVFARPLATFLGMEDAVLGMKLLAPAFFCNAVAGGIMGYFQGMGTATPTVVSGVLKRLFEVTFSLLFGYILYGYGQRTAALLHKESVAYMYGAAGAAGGFLLASLLSLCFLMLLYLGSAKTMKKRRTEGMRLTENKEELIRQLVVGMLPLAGFFVLNRIVLLLGQLLYHRYRPEAVSAYGSYYGGYLTVAGIVIALALFITAGVEHTLLRSYKREEYGNAHNQLTGGILSIVLSAGFFSVLCSCMAPQLMSLWQASDTVAAHCLQMGFIMPIFMALGIFFGRILNGMGKRRIVLLNVLSAVVCYVLTAIIFGSIKGIVDAEEQIVSSGAVDMLLFAQLVFSIVYCVANGILLFKTMQFTPEWIRLTILPIAALGVTGLCVFLICRAFADTLGAAFVVLLGTAAGAVCYPVLLFVLHCIRKEDLAYLPGSGILRKIGMILHLF